MTPAQHSHQQQADYEASMTLIGYPHLVRAIDTNRDESGLDGDREPIEIWSTLSPDDEF